MVILCAVCGNTQFVNAELTEVQESVKNNVPDEIPYKTCTRCGLWAQFPPPTFQYEADDEKDNRKTGILEEAGHFRWLAKRLAKDYSPKTVLDIGSSYPLLLSLLKNKHNVLSVMGIDGCDKALEYAEELDVPVVNSNFLEHDFGDRKFDLITMVHVIEHFSEPLLPVLKMKSLLNPGGKVFIRTPLNDTTGLTRWHLTEGHFQVHPIVFSQRSLKMLFELAGMKLLKEAVGDNIGHGDYDFYLR